MTISGEGPVISAPGDFLAHLAGVFPGCVASVRIRPDGTCHVPYCSDGIVRLCGLNPEVLALDLTPFLERLHPDDRPRLRAEFLRARDAHGPLHVEFRYRHPDGREIWLESHSAPQSEPGGGMVWHGWLSDITGRKAHEEALCVSEARFRDIAESLSEAIWLLDMESGTMLYSNPALWALLGRDPSPTFTVEDWLSAVHPDDAALTARRRDELRCLVSGRSDAVYRIVRSNGEVRWVRSRASVTSSGAGGRGQRVIATFEDITESRATEQRLHQAQKMESMGQLASGVAHDFNNWLTVIIGYVELLATMVPGESMASKCVSEIRRASERATGLTRQLLAFSRNEPIEPRVVDVNLLVADTQRMLRRLLGEDITLVSALDPGAGRVKVDPTQWVQVLTNLAVNARDAMPTGGTLTIATSAATVDPERAAAHGVPPGRYVCLSVSDTGCGIPREVQVRVFEPFFTTKAVGRGTGLGLAVVFAAVERSGGFLELTSSAGAGAQFRLYVPEALESPAAASVGPAGVIDGSERVLVVEDEGTLRDVACQTLRSHGYDVLQAADGAQAIGILAEHGADIDVLFTDVVMPDKGGREVVEAARARW
ncbi:MAG: PAS domain-containing protein, partial [Vicinamibacterales bacterium]